MIRGRLPVAALASIALATLIGACGSSASNQAGTSTVAQSTRGEQFATCMRSNGVSQFPDPPASGNFTIDEIAHTSPLDTSSPAFTQALTACRRLQPAGFTGSRRTAAQQQAALELARCIRKNGVSDFPDPISGKPLVDTELIPSTQQPGGMSALKAGMRKCSDLAAGAGVTR